MFNLIMQYQPWDPVRGTVAVGRMMEHTDEPTADRFRNHNGQIELARLIELPCLFMQEGTGDQLARVGMITRARFAGQQIAIEYVFEADVPPIVNRDIFDRMADFDVDHEFEFSRTHWAVKYVDLYRALLRFVRPRRQRPVVFQIEEHERIEPQLISVMMPFDAQFDLVYRSIRNAARAADLRARRADDIWENAAIIQDVVSLIDRSFAVICDCTGRNPNVFYEIGIAHTLGREVILTTQSDEDIPFDLRHLRYVRCLNNGQSRRALAAALTARLEALVAR